MKSTKFLEGLRERKAEIEAELASVQPLLDDLADIERMLARHSKGANGALKLPFKPASKRHTFQADPHSRASRVLSESRQVLENVPSHEMPFLDLCEKLSPDLASTSALRQQARMALQRSGKRLGINYVDANRVRLEI